MTFKYILQSEGCGMFVIFFNFVVVVGYIGIATEVEMNADELLSYKFVIKLQKRNLL